MFKGPTYKASLYFQQQLFLKVLRQCGKSFGDQNTIKVFCHPSEKKKNKNKNVQFLTLTAESTLVSDLIYEKKNLTPLPELTMCAHALIVWNSAPACSDYLVLTESGAPNENIVQNHINIALLNVL